MHGMAGKLALCHGGHDRKSLPGLHLPSSTVSRLASLLQMTNCKMVIYHSCKGCDERAVHVLAWQPLTGRVAAAQASCTTSSPRTTRPTTRA